MAEEKNLAQNTDAPETPDVELEGAHDEPVDSANEEYPHGLRLVTVVAAVMLTVFLTSLDQTIVGTAIPKITDEFHGLSQVSWYGSAYFMCLGGFQSSWGKAYRYFPLKLCFIVSVVIFELGSLICGVSPSSVAFIVGRAIAGVGGAGVSSGGTVILAFCAEPKKRPTLMGFVGVAYTVAAICGLALALLIAFFKTPSSASVVPATWMQKIWHMDPVGIVLSMGAIISFILALQYGGQTYDWSSSVVVGLLVGFVIILAALAVAEYYQGEYAMMPLRLLKRRSLWTGCAYQFFFASCYFLLLYYLPIYFQSIRGGDAIQSGVDNLPLVIAGCLAVLAGGIAVTKTRHATPFMALGAALATVATGLLYTLDVDTSSAKWIGYQILAGAALAFPFQNALNIAQADVDSSDISTVTATLYYFQVLGGAFSISSAQCAFVNVLLSSLRTSAPGVNPLLVVNTGATELRSVFTAEQLQGIVRAYMEAIKASFAVGIGMVGIAFVLSLICPWKRLHAGAVGDAMPVG
ncbi:MFS general substrate transporter [Penicillium diatomitis]|uniref:MFS general substrate transporter n=1 Tax=Penicillium diatomitis TaxID=2819901 RepID=A0A9X0C2V5_9EURO|nr:MFS general substrate transporter [Penicillium diatomitis]KAJ5495550.1 MFS general substrate transporter [Penicillium diatomitis]